jgi:hypothetical protein
MRSIREQTRAVLMRRAETGDNATKGETMIPATKAKAVAVSRLSEIYVAGCLTKVG